MNPGVATAASAPTAHRLAAILAEALDAGLAGRALADPAVTSILPIDGADGVVVTLSGGAAHRALVVASPRLTDRSTDPTTGFLPHAASALEAWARGHGAAVTGSVPVASPDAVAQVFEPGTDDVMDAIALDLDGVHVATVAVLFRVDPAVPPEPASPEDHVASPEASVTEPASAEPLAARSAAPESVAARSPLSLLADVEMTVTAELGRTRMNVSDLLNLGPGSVVELDRAAGSPADLLVNGTPVARGEVVVVDEEYAIRVTEILGTGEV
jgi:flagellar motor switch protein FliN/FliY